MKYYLYDAQTKVYLDTVEADTQPANSTTISPFVVTDGVAVAPIGVYFTGSNWVKPTVLSEKQMIMQQSQQITLLQTMVMQQDQSNAKLQAANAQQTTQIKQLQQMFMTADQQQAVEKSKEVNA